MSFRIGPARELAAGALATGTTNRSETRFTVASPKMTVWEFNPLRENEVATRNYIL